MSIHKVLAFTAFEAGSFANSPQGANFDPKGEVEEGLSLSLSTRMLGFAPRGVTRVEYSLQVRY
jgi:hypothetical protein